MRLYIDDDSVQRLLRRLLQGSGHDIDTPVGAHMVSEADAVHLTYAVKTDRVLLSRNHGDFLRLHNLVKATGGTHPGILIVCQENNTRRDMTPHQVVRALENLLASGAAIKNQLTILNRWR